MVLLRLHVILLAFSLQLPLLLNIAQASSSLIRPPQSVGVQHDSPFHTQGIGIKSPSNDIPPPNPFRSPSNQGHGQDPGPEKDLFIDNGDYGPRRAPPQRLKTPNIPPPVSSSFGGAGKPGNGDYSNRGPSSLNNAPQLPGFSSEQTRFRDPPIGERNDDGYNIENVRGRLDATAPGSFDRPGQSIPGINNGDKNIPFGNGIPSPHSSPENGKTNLVNGPHGASAGYNLHHQPNPHDYPSPSQRYNNNNNQPVPKNNFNRPSAQSKKPDALSHPGFSVPPELQTQNIGLPGTSKPPPPPFRSSPLVFPKDLKIEQNFPFQSPISFSRPRSFPPRRSAKPSAKDSLLNGFFTPLDTFATQPSLPEVKERVVPSTQNEDRQSQSVDIPKYQGGTQNFASNRSPGRIPANQPHFQTQRPDGYQDPYSGNAYPGNTNTGSGQCFRYTFPAEAYRLSYIAKAYPLDSIQKEIDSKPYLAPLVGMEAKEKEYNPFSFNSPISSHFDYDGFGFGNNAAKPADKYSYLKNVKAYPGNLKEKDFVGEHPISMQPLNSACPSEKHNLQSFFYHGGDCFVINPSFQDVAYYRCLRRDCNFCGVRRGLSACVETYKWTSVIAYCTRLKEMSRIVPLRLILPVGCTCQHYAC